MRSRSGGTASSITFRRKKRSSRKRPGAMRLAQVGVGRGQHAHVHAPRLARAQALELAALQHAQQLHLAGRREVADLVEEQRAAVGGLEAADAPLGGAGVGARLGAEQLALQQLVRAGRRRSPSRTACRGGASWPGRSRRSSPCPRRSGPVISTGTSAVATCTASDDHAVHGRALVDQAAQVVLRASCSRSAAPARAGARARALAHLAAACARWPAAWRRPRAWPGSRWRPP